MSVTTFFSIHLTQSVKTQIYWHDRHRIYWTHTHTKKNHNELECFQTVTVLLLKIIENPKQTLQVTQPVENFVNTSSEKKCNSLMLMN